MTPDAAERLVIFDYSGTLSLEAPRFGHRENLLRALADSGLASLGVSTPEIYWEEIVAPTWTEGSTTGIGYKRIMTERILARGIAPGRTGREVADAASRFVDRYLDRSPIDPGWQPVLRSLASAPDAALVIATDHYAEATEAIARHLRIWNIRARKADPQAASPAPEGEQGRDRSSPCLIANSADIGFWKADRRFWNVLRRNPRLERIQALLIVDDFGFNEEPGDLYGARLKVEARRETTRKALEEAFGAPPAMVPFFLEGGGRLPDGGERRSIGEAGRSIRSFLSGR